MKKMIDYSWFNLETAYKNGWELNVRIGSCHGYGALFDFQF